MLRPDVSVYYNIDDYTLYWPASASQVRALERAAVLAADVTVCVSRLRADELMATIPKPPGEFTTFRMGLRLRSWPTIHSSVRLSRPLTWPGCRGPISATSAPSRTGWIGSCSAN